MPLDLGNVEEKTTEAVKAFWGNRIAAHKAQLGKGSVDQSQRGAVVGGKNMDGFIALAREIVLRNGLSDQQIFVGRSLPTLPGYFRATKCWDMVIVNGNRLIAAIEFKSHVGSFGNNFNNRVEEALGSAVDLRTALRENAFGETSQPFIGWFMVLEDNPEVHRALKEKTLTFSVARDFKGTSYAQRYHGFCDKLVRENLYTATALILTPQSAVATGHYTELSESTGIKSFFATLAGHIAAEVLRKS